MKKGLVLCLLLPALISARQAQKVDQVELQPLTAQARRLVEAMDYLGAPIKQADREALEKAGDETDAAKARRSVQSAKERDEAAKAYEHARQTYRRILAECEVD